MQPGCVRIRALAGFAAFAALMVVGAGAQGQLFRGGRGQAPAAAQQQKAAAKAAAPVVAQAEVTKRLVDPSEPIAKINGEAITRQQLADECVARRGEEILETLIARKLIDQAVRMGKVQVTPAEVDAEIERVAQSIAGVSREKWLATLAKERKISPSQYARDIIYPALALRKLAEPQVQVTEQDMKEALESHFGAKLRCRMIMLNSLSIAKEVWEEVKKNPSVFEKVAQEKSIDPSTRSVGGMLPDPISRHAMPRTVSDAAFAQLVDVDKSIDPKSPDYEKYRPKDGEVSGIIQVTDATWVILKREGVMEARPYDDKDPMLRKQMEGMIRDAKVQEKIGELYAGLLRQAAIENFLTGQIKPAGSEELSAAQVDGEVKLMSNPPAPAADAPAGGEAAPAAPAPVSAPAPPLGTAPAPAPAAAGGAATPAVAAPHVGVTNSDASRATDLLKPAK